MPAKIDALKSKTAILYRSTLNISKIEANVSYVDKDAQRHVQIENLNNPAATRIDIAMTDVQYIKMKDFCDKNNSTSWILAIGEKKPVTDPTQKMLGYDTIVQHSFHFEKKEERDQWDHGLRSVLAQCNVGSQSADVKVQGTKYRAIKQVTLQQPPPGMLIAIKVELDGDDKEIEMLTVPERDPTAEECKKVTNKYIEDHAILPTENTSLYRYIRSVVQRALMEKETASIIEEINAQRFEKLAADLGMDVASPTDCDKVILTAEEALSRISDSIPRRVGQHGSGATIVNTILKRNVEKMKLINQVAAKVAKAESQRG